MSTTEPIESQNFKYIIGLGAIIGVVGSLLLLPSFAATDSKSFEAEKGTVAGNAATAMAGSGFSGEGYVSLNGGPTGGTTVPLPSSAPSGSNTSVTGSPLYGTVGCHASEPVCIFGWQNDDIYDGSCANPHSGEMQMRNIQTGAVIKEFSANGAAGAPQTANRPLAIHNPDDNEWLIVYHGTTATDCGALTKMYGVIVDANGNYKGSTLTLSNNSLRGWVPKGVYDKNAHSYYLQWHQSTDDYHVKDMFATVVSRAGTVTENTYNVNKTPDTLTEYGTVAFNSTTGEILSLASEGKEEGPPCGGDCTRKIVAVRLKIDGAGKLSEVGRHELETDPEVEWGLSMDYNKPANSFVATFRKGTSGRGDGGLTKVYAMVLNADGTQKATAVELANGTTDTYWVTGTGCSSQTNICASSFIAQGAYVDAASSGTTKISPVGQHGAGNFTWNGSKTAYVSALDKFVIFGAGTYMEAPGR